MIDVNTVIITSENTFIVKFAFIVYYNVPL